MDKSPAPALNQSQAKFNIRSNNTILPQRFIKNYSQNKNVKKLNEFLPEIENAIKIDELLSTCKQDSIQKVKSQKLAPMKNLSKTDSEPILLNHLKKPLNKISGNEMFLSKIDLDEKKTPKITPSNFEKKDKESEDFDEACFKIKELNKKSHHYQIYEQIQQKHKTTSNLQKMQKTLNGKNMTSQKIFDKNNKKTCIEDNYLEIKSYFALPIDFKIPKKFISKRQFDDSLNLKNTFRLGEITNLQYPFKNDVRECEISLELSKKAFPGVLDVVNKNDRNMRFHKALSEKRGSHDFHICFNLGLTYESEKDYERSNGFYFKFLDFAIETQDKFAVYFTTNKIGINFLKLGDFLQAEETFSQNVVLLPKDKLYVAHYNIGLCQKMSQKYQLALSHFLICQTQAKVVKVG